MGLKEHQLKRRRSTFWGNQFTNLVVAATFLHASPSFCDSCAEDQLIESDGPQPSSDDVPINSAIFIQYDLDDDVSDQTELSTTGLVERYEIVDSDGTRITGDWHVVKSKRNPEDPLVFFVPSELFAPASEYEVVLKQESDDAGITRNVLATFNTGTESVEPEQSPPSASVSTSTTGYGWAATRVTLTGDTYFKATSTATFSVGTTPGGVALLRNDDDPGDFDDESVEGTVADLTSNGALIAAGSGCGVRNWEAQPGSVGRFRVGLIDQTGAFTGWSEPIDVAAPMLSTCACAAASQSPFPTSIAILLLLSAAIARRRHRPEAIKAANAG